MGTRVRWAVGSAVIIMAMGSGGVVSGLLLHCLPQLFLICRVLQVRVVVEEEDRPDIGTMSTGGEVGSFTHLFSE